MAAVTQLTTHRADAGTPARRHAPLFREAVGRVLREERTARAERLVDVAREAAISPQYLSEIERGAKDPSSEVLRSVSDALELPTAEVVRRASSLMVGPARPAERRVTAPTALLLAA